MKTFTPFLETLPEAQQRIWPSLAPVVSLGFVLYGGTAVALQLGHRISGDFVFFKQESLDINKIYEQLPFCQQGRIIQDQPKALQLNYAGVKFFFGESDFGRVRTPLTTDDRILSVASLDDLMAVKIGGILLGSSLNEYQDIAAMIEDGVSLEKGLAAAGQMFGAYFALSVSLRTRNHSEDGVLANRKKIADQESSCRPDHLS